MERKRINRLIDNVTESRLSYLFSSPRILWVGCYVSDVSADPAIWAVHHSLGCSGMVASRSHLIIMSLSSSSFLPFVVTLYLPRLSVVPPTSVSDFYLSVLTREIGILESPYAVRRRML